MIFKVISASLWVFASVIHLQSCTEAISSVASPNKTTGDNKSLASQSNFGIPRRLPSPWRHVKFPVLPPRMRNRQRRPSSSTLETTTSTFAPSSTELITTTEIQDQIVRRRMDIIDASSSENNPRSVVWPVRVRPAKRFRAPTPTTEIPHILLKLLQPRPTRPAIYSLDGFVPKPSLQKIISSTTEAPYHFRKTDLQFLSSVPRRRKINRFSKEEEDDEDYPLENEANIRRKKPVSRYTAFARKGVPGRDYPVFTFIPQTIFECESQLGPGLFADPFTDCQVWHMCPGGNLSPRHSFLCPNGTIFNQKKRICDWWYNVDCGNHHRHGRSAINLFPLVALNDTMELNEEWDMEV